MELVIIDSVEPGNHSLLDQKEEEWIQRLRTMDSMNQGGLNIRDDLKRRDRGKCNNCTAIASFAKFKNNCPFSFSFKFFLCKSYLFYVFTV